MTKNQSETNWVTIDRPGYFGKSREEQERIWNEKYGQGNWRLAWETPQGESLTFDEVIQEYIAGYAEYFREHPEEAQQLTRNYAYAYDKEIVPKEEAFNPHALYQIPGKANQFHHAALNIALENVLGLSFKGEEPIKVRAGKPNTTTEEWPEGWRWHPGRISCIHPELIQDVSLPNQWWEEGSIEDLYQSDKVLQVRKISEN